MGYYLIDHPPARYQYRDRRAQPSGVILLHSTESMADVNPPDAGAENVARYIRDRDTAGSYHGLADADSTVDLIPPWLEAFHCGTYKFNHHTLGYSVAWQAHKMASLEGKYRSAALRNLAEMCATAARWLADEHGIAVPARRISLNEARRGVAGFITHGTCDPSRRSDPDHSRDGSAFPWDEFFEYFRHYQGDGPLYLFKSAEEARPFVESAYQRIAGRPVESEHARETWVYACVVDPKSCLDLITALHNEFLTRTRNEQAKQDKRLAELEGKTYKGPKPMTESEILASVAAALID